MGLYYPTAFYELSNGAELDFRTTNWELLAKYHFLDPANRFRFYAGAGFIFVTLRRSFEDGDITVTVEGDTTGHGVKLVTGIEAGSERLMFYAEVGYRLVYRSPLDLPIVEASDFNNVPIMVGYRLRWGGRKR